ncbi:hypothetical protein V8E52_006645 [Russula decolorans]
MPEICSARTTSCGPYCCVAMMSKPQGAPFAARPEVTGWFNPFGGIAVTMGNRYCTSYSAVILHLFRCDSDQS